MYWISCTISAANSNTTSSLDINVALPILHLTMKINAIPFTSYKCHSYASNEVGNGPSSRTVHVPPIPLGEYLLLFVTLNCTL